jgi:hypothetical protein
MKFNKWKVGLFATAIILCCSAARVQGNVTFTPIDGTTFSNYLSYDGGSAAVINTGGNIGFSSIPSSFVGYDGPSALETYVTLAQSAGTITIKALITDGVAGTTGESFSTSGSSTVPIYGLVIGILSPFQGQRATVTIDNLYVGASYQSPVASTSDATFSGMLVEFENQTTSFTSSFTMTAGQVASGSQVYMVPITQPVPEPDSIILVAISGLLVLFTRHRK